MNSEFPTRLSHILEACTQLHEIIKNTTYEKFINDMEKIYASSFLFIVIGEAASHISDGLEESLPSFPWKKIIGMRHRIAHGYFSIDHDVLWKTAVDDVPDLQKNVKKILDEL